MNISTYQSKARKTAIYPGQGFGVLGIAYVALGLANEVGEFIEKHQLAYTESEVNAEAGDVLWYVAQIATEISNQPLGALVLAEEFTDLRVPSPITAVDQAQAKDDLVRAAARIAGQAKKIVRDNPEGKALEERAKSIETDLHLTMESLAILVGGGSVLGGCAEGNLAKLASRAERGALMGDGDNR